MAKFTFPKESRLLTSLHFSYVFEQPHRVNAPHFVIFGRLNLLEHPRIGLSVSKKNVKHAYERNRIKRLMRESFRMRQNELMPMDFVIAAKKGISNLNNYTLLRELEKLWHHYFYLAHKSL